MKSKTNYICQVCEYIQPKWTGKCGQCESWNSFTEKKMLGNKIEENSIVRKNSSKLISEIQSLSTHKFSSGIDEFDRVLGGGIVTGSVILIGGDPGVGKSTLLLELCDRVEKCHSDKKILYVSGEESEQQIFRRFKRLGLSGLNLRVLHEASWEEIKNNLDELKSDILILDSIQTTFSENVSAMPGMVSQIREVTFEVMNYSKKNNMTSFIVGHITKEGAIAGPKILEHMVDTVIYFEGDRTGLYRMLRVIKNRFGSVNEIGMFEMKEDGLKEIHHLTQCFLENPLKDSFGRSISCILNGSRPMFVELQALVTDAKNGPGRRIAQGLDTSRLTMLIAILEKYIPSSLSFNDIHFNVAGGFQLSGADADLGVLAALLSSLHSKLIPESTVFLGEVGLTGEVRPVIKIDQRLNEINNLKYKKVVVSKKIASKFKSHFNFDLIGIDRCSELKDLIGI